MARLCRSCCGSMPFGLGADSQSSSSSSLSQRSISKATKSSKAVSEEEETTSEESWEGSQAGEEVPPVKPEIPSDFRPPSEGQVQILAKTWITHVHQRAAKIWTRSQVIGMLETLARSVNYTEDPILGDMSPSAPCVQWHGELSEQGYPVVSIQKPSNPDATSTYLCRVLAFLFADDDSLKLLKQVGGGPSAEMNCGNTKCARLSHLVGFNTKWALRYVSHAKAKAGAGGQKAGAGQAKAKAKAAAKAKPKGA